MKKYRFIFIFIFIFVLVLSLFTINKDSVSSTKKDKKAGIRAFNLTTSTDYTNPSQPLVTLDWSDYGSSSNSIFKGYQSKDCGSTWERQTRLRSCSRDRRRPGGCRDRRSWTRGRRSGS